MNTPSPAGGRGAGGEGVFMRKNGRFKIELQ